MWHLDNSLILPNPSPLQLDLVTLPWEHIVGDMTTILLKNQPNDKRTYRPYLDWELSDRRFVTALAPLLNYEQVKPGVEYRLSIQDLFLQTNLILEDEIGTEALLRMHDNDRLNTYDRFLRWVGTQWLFDNPVELDTLARLYKTYRGMAHLKAYWGDLEHPDLLVRSDQNMRVVFFANQVVEWEWREQHWGDVKASYLKIV